jgi:hypothetical protein
MSFEWTLGGAFLLQRSSVPVPGAPDGTSVIGPDAGDATERRRTPDAGRPFAVAAAAWR